MKNVKLPLNLPAARPPLASLAHDVALTGGLLAGLFWGLGRLYPHVSLTQWAYEAGVLGIKTARWLFGGGA